MKIDAQNTQLVLELTTGSVQAFDILYHQYHKSVFANIFKLVRNQQEAEDLVQDVFIALWEHRHNLDSEQSILGWLLVVSHNKSVNHLRKSVRRALQNAGITPPEIGEQPQESETESDPDLQLRVLEEAIDQLPLRKKQAFTLCKLQGKTYEETASILGISVNTVKEHIALSSKFIKAYVSDKSPSAAVGILALLHFVQ